MVQLDSRVINLEEQSPLDYADVLKKVDGTHV